jgi:hypothetical protein
VIETNDSRPPSRLAALKVIYLLAVTTIVFAVPSVRFLRPWRWHVVIGIATLQLVTLLVCRVPVMEILRTVTRLKWFYAFLLICYGLLPGEYGGPKVHAWRLAINVGGLKVAALMCLQILTVVLVSAVVRLTSRGTDLADGLARLGLPKLFVHAFDHTLSLLAGRPRGRRDEGGNRPKGGFIQTLRRLIRGDVGFLIQSVKDNMERARVEMDHESGGRMDHRLSHDVAVVSGTALVMASLKMLKFLPGVPFAPGIKGVILLPLYVLASQRTWSRWGGTAAGSIMGVIGFLQGDGRFGVLDILQHVAPGVVIDLLMPLVRRLPQTALTYCALGFVATISRSITAWLVVLLLGSRAEVYLFPAVGLVPMLIAGTLSGFVTIYLLRAFPQDELPATRTEYSGEHQEEHVVRRTGQGV